MAGHGTVLRSPGRRPRPAPAHGSGWSRALPVLALPLALLLGIALARHPLLVLALFATAAGVALALKRPETVAVVALMATFGFMPFLDPATMVGGKLPIGILGWALAMGLLLYAWGSRRLAGAPSFAFNWNLLSFAVLLLFVFTLLRLVASNPLQVPSLSLPFMELPVTALIVALWLTHEEAIDGLKAAIPIAVVFFVVWGISYIGGSSGHCSACLRVIQSGIERPGLLGPTSRLYASGNETSLGLTLVAFGLLLWRRSPLVLGLTLLGFACVALEASRAQYIAVAAGSALMIAWRYREMRFGGRLLLIAGTAAAVAAIALSPIGQRAFSGYHELSNASGNGGYRLALIQDQKKNWNFFGNGVSNESINRGVDTDLGIPNTLLVMGFFGAFLQVAVFLLAMLRGLAGRGLAGPILAAVSLMVIVGRPSLPLLEYGSSSATYGIVLGFACALATRGALHRRRLEQHAPEPALARR